MLRLLIGVRARSWMGVSAKAIRTQPEGRKARCPIYGYFQKVTLCMTNTKMLLTYILAVDDQPNTLQFRRCLLFKALGRQKCEHSLVPRFELPARQSGRETFMSAA